MRYRKLDKNGDYAFGNQQADFHRDVPAAVVQAVVTRLRLLRGEWFFDLSEGVPYATGVLGKHTQSTYDAIIRERIRKTEGVKGIASYQSRFDPDTRCLNLSVVLDTVYGPSPLEATL